VYKAPLQGRQFFTQAVAALEALTVVQQVIEPQALVVTVAAVQALLQPMAQQVQLTEAVVAVVGMRVLALVMVAQVAQAWLFCLFLLHDTQAQPQAHLRLRLAGQTQSYSSTHQALTRRKSWH
jgi:hypothetical protein